MGYNPTSIGFCQQYGDPHAQQQPAVAEKADGEDGLVVGSRIKSLEPIPPARQDDPADAQDDAQFMHALLQRRALPDRGAHLPGYPAHGGTHSGLDHHRPAAAAGHVGRHPNHVVPIRHGSIFLGVSRLFGDRFRFPRQSRFVRLEIIAGKDSSVGGHPIPRFEHQHISGHHVRGIHLGGFPSRKTRAWCAANLRRASRAPSARHS